MNFKPWNYQEYAINHVMDHNAGGLFLYIGIGKTVRSLTAIDNLLFKRIKNINHFRNSETKKC